VSHPPTLFTVGIADKSSEFIYSELGTKVVFKSFLEGHCPESEVEF